MQMMSIKLLNNTKGIALFPLHNIFTFCIPPAFVISALRARIAAFMRDMSLPPAEVALAVKLQLSTTRSQGLFPFLCSSIRAKYYFSCSVLFYLRSFSWSSLYYYHFLSSSSAFYFRSRFESSSAYYFWYCSALRAWFACSTFSMRSFSSSVRSSSIWDTKLGCEF